MFKTAYFMLFAALIALAACQTEQSKRQLTAPVSPKSTLNTDNLSKVENNEEDTVNLKMTAHATQIVLQPEDFGRHALADAHVKELKDWWDSLPQPVQSKVKSHRVSVEVVSNIRTNSPTTTPQTKQSDAQIEQTGAALEKVIGSNTEMTYTVNTTVVEKVQTNQPKLKTTAPNELATTDILLVETVPVKLSQFALELPLIDRHDLNTETAQALQYWWNTLPEDLQLKIKQQEINVHLSVHSIDRDEIDKYNGKPVLGLNADHKIVVIEDVLTRIIGAYRAGNRSIPLAKINSTANIEKASAQNAHIRSNQYMRIQLKNNKTSINTSSAM